MKAPFCTIFFILTHPLIRTISPAPVPVYEETEHYSNAIYGIHSNSISSKMVDTEVLTANKRAQEEKEEISRPGENVDDINLEEQSMYLNVSQIRHLTG